jgi:hypothetical protein
MAAMIIAGRKSGQLPVVTVPLGIVGAVVFALWPSIKPSTRLKVTAGGAAAFIVSAWLFA